MNKAFQGGTTSHGSVDCVSQVFGIFLTLSVSFDNGYIGPPDQSTTTVRVSMVLNTISDEVL